jgi:hypothetical protein
VSAVNRSQLTVHQMQRRVHGVATNPAETLRRARVKQPLVR